MTTSHTPGPWTLPVGVIGIDKVWDSEGEFEIANLYTQGKIGWEQTEANARLIAAAPELLAELENVLKELERATGYDRQDEISAAIARAKGDGMKSMHERPLAAAGLTSYRARGRFGFIMIGAKDHTDAWNEARRSTDAPTDLEVWDGVRYVPAVSP